MATTAQVAANRLNALLSTGPTSSAGKAAVARNAVSHGLSSATFTVLPGENPDDFQALLQALTAEHQPDTPSESFLVREMAHAQWKLQRIAGIEAEILASPEAMSPLARRFAGSLAASEVLLKLDRYEQSTRRNWYKALTQLRQLRAQNESSDLRRRRAHDSELANAIDQYINAPMPEPIAAAQTSMPAHLERELEAHRRRDPLFDPIHDRSQMSKSLRKWFETH